VRKLKAPQLGSEDKSEIKIKQLKAAESRSPSELLNIGL